MFTTPPQGPMLEAQTPLLRAAVVGAGKFGRYHAAKYSAMQGVELVGIVDSSSEAVQHAARQYDCHGYTSLEDLEGKIDIVSIATPAMSHADTAIRLLEAGVHTYIEKPLAATLEDADRIIAAAKAKHCVLQVGHQERFLLARMGLLDRKETPRSIECHRVTTWQGRGVDVSAALDLMIHDLDLVLQLAPGQADVLSANARSHKGSFGDEVTAELQIGTCHIRLLTSRIGKTPERYMSIEYDDGSIFIDFLARMIEDTRPITVKASFGDDVRGPPSFDPLGAAMTDFVRCVRTGDTPLVTGEDARRALHEALNILAVAQSPATREAPSSVMSTEQIKFFDLQTPAHRIRADVERRLGAVLDHMQYIDGPEVTALETALSAYAGTNYALTVSSGTDALLIALMGEDLSREDAVFLPAFTYNATCNAVLMAGATPVFVDVHRETCNMDSASLDRAILRVLKDRKLRPRMIIAVDLYGLPAPYPQLLQMAKRYDMLVLSDAAQAFGGQQGGLRVGSLCDMTATSFYPTKTLGAYGDGGALFTNDQARYERWSSIRWHGTDAMRSVSVRLGINGRLSSMQSAIILAKLTIFPEELEARSVHAAHYRRRLTGRVQFQEQGTPTDEHAYGIFTVILENREQAQQALKAKGIPTATYYMKPLHRHEAFAQYAPEQALPNSDWLSERVLSLPFHPYLSESQIDYVCDALLGIVSSKPQPRL